MATTFEKERQLREEIVPRVVNDLPEVDVLAVELVSPQRFCVYVDHPAGVDHALCERVTNVLRGYLDRYSLDVSSPGLERPLRKPAHFANAVGRRVALRTEHEIAGRKRFRGKVLAASERGVRLGPEGSEPVLIPYDDIVRGNV